MGLRTPDEVKRDLEEVGLSEKQLRQVERIFRNYRFCIWSWISLDGERRALAEWGKGG